jgi:hypothetical protein
MRKIVAGMFMTLDGVVEVPEKWNPPYHNQEMTEAVQAQLAAGDTHLYGRRSYEESTCSRKATVKYQCSSSNPSRSPTA